MANDNKNSPTKTAKIFEAMTKAFVKDNPKPKPKKKSEGKK